MSCIYIACKEGDNLIKLLHKKLEIISDNKGDKSYDITYITPNSAHVVFNNQEIFKKLLYNNTALHKLFALDWTTDAYDEEETLIMKTVTL